MTAEPEGRAGQFSHLILFDGDCGLCLAGMEFVVRADPEATFAFAPLDGDVARRVLATRAGGDQRSATMYVAAHWGSGRETLLDRSEAVLFVASRLGWPWSMARFLRWLPRRARDGAYDLIAANRHRFGQSGAHCGLASRSAVKRLVGD